MLLVILSLHLLVCVCLIGLVLLQRSEGGALGMGGGGGSLVSGRGAADALARMTSVAGGFFLATSLGLTFLSGAAGANSGGGIDFSTAPVAAPAVLGGEDSGDVASGESEGEQVASLTPTTPEATSGNTSERAAPLPASPSATAPTPTPVRTTPAPTTTRTPTPPRSTETANNRPLVLPNTSGGGAALTLDPAQLGGESDQSGDRLEAVRRERAGPDQ